MAGIKKRDTIVQVFAKYPIAGNVKTRLSPLLGMRGAAEFHASLVTECITKLSNLPGNIKVELWGDKSAQSPFFKQILQDNPRLGFKHQVGKDLGQRMNFAVRSGLMRYEKVIVIGVDCPELDCSRIIQVSEMIQANQLHIVAAEDGGYVLLGLGSYHSSIFRLNSWGTPVVFTETLEKAYKIAWLIYQHGTLPDIDLPEDYIRWKNSKAMNAVQLCVK